jgi:predicted RNase H-like nuclease
MAKAAASLLAAVVHATRRFESFPSPPHLDEVGLWVEVL